MFHFLPMAIRYDGSAPLRGHGYQVHVGPMYSNSRGKLKIKSPNPMIKPQIYFNYLSTKEDRKEWIEAIHAARKILNQPAMEAFNGYQLLGTHRPLDLGCIHGNRNAYHAPVLARTRRNASHERDDSVLKERRNHRRIAHPHLVCIVHTKCPPYGRAFCLNL
jgi:choline dehydrogenase-like flavoprotein